MNANLKGIYSALLTPYRSDESIDEASLRNLVQFNIRLGVDGLYVGGSTGEAFIQSVDERAEILEIVKDESAGKLKLIAHVGCISTKESEYLANISAKLKYDAVSAVTPFYYPFGFDEIAEHYKNIISSANGLPMIIYNIPALSGVKLTRQQILDLLNMDKVAAIKQTSGDLYQLEQIRRDAPNKIIYNGYDEILFSGLVAGADGGIGSTYNIMGARYCAILKAFKEGDITSAKQLQSDCNEVIDTLIEVGVFKGLKQVLKNMGVIENAICRKPFSPINPKHHEKLTLISDTLSKELNLK
ncbi:N-acetylneuraminate lyase [Escherichia coli]|nr:N-acetylneuraminate lyase [Escherichia coli]